MLCDQLSSLIAGEPSERSPVVCDVSRLVADLRAVDALARLALAARRLGSGIAISGSSPVLDGLIARCGLSGVIPAAVPDPPPPARRRSAAEATPDGAERPAREAPG